MSTEQTKAWYLSRTIWGGLIAILPALGIVGFQFDLDSGDFSGNVYTLWPQLVSISGGAIAIFGRAKATAGLA